jgi:hypothetical protein
MPLVDEFLSLSLDTPPTTHLEASALQVLQTIGQIIVQARTQACLTSLKQSFEEEGKTKLNANWVNVELEEITAVNRDLHLWFKALCASNLLTIDIILRADSPPKQTYTLVERWSISYISKEGHIPEERSHSQDINPNIAPTIRSLFSYATDLPIYTWMREAPAKGYSVISQYGPSPPDTFMGFSTSTPENFSLPTIESMFGHFSLSVLHTKEIDTLVCKNILMSAT